MSVGSNVFSDFTIRARDQFTGPMRGMSQQATMFSRSTQRSLGRVNNGFRNMQRIVRMAGVALTTGLVARGVGALINQARGVEDAIARFQPLLGGLEQARDAVAALNETAATTPFQFEQLADAASTLLGFGAATQDTMVDTLRMIGDTAGGSADRMNRLSLAFSQTQAAGRASMREINQFINAGVPILGELADMWGVTVGEAREMVTAGQATGEEVTRAFRRMTSEGGRFYRGMEIASATLSGRLSTLKDNISLTGAAIGEALMPVVKDVTDSLIEAAGTMRQWVNANQDLIALRVEEAIQAIANAGRFLYQNWENGLIPAALIAVATFKSLAAVIMGAKGLYAAFVALKALFAGGGIATIIAGGPIAWIVAGIAAIAAGAFLIVKHWGKVKEFFVRFWEDWGNHIGIALTILHPMIGIPLLIARNWATIIDVLRRIMEWIDRIFDRWNSFVDRVSGPAGSGATDYGMQPRTYGRGVTENNITTNRSEVDIDINGLPQGSTVSQRGRAPGVSLTQGYRGTGAPMRRR